MDNLHLIKSTRTQLLFSKHEKLFALTNGMSFYRDTIACVVALLLALIVCSCVEADPVGDQQLQAFDRNISKLLEKSYWEYLAPELHINDAIFIKSFHPFAFNEDPARNSYKELLVKEGYVQKRPMNFQVNIKQMKAVMDHLSQQDIPVVFAFVYDEFWIMFYRLHRHLQGAISPNYIRLPVFWAWRVDPKKSQKGFTPHRDEYDATKAIFPDGTPQKLGVWIPLSDATPMNGCMYILPADRDPTYNVTDGSRDLSDQQNHWFEFIQDFRALPAKAQSVLMWNFRVYHYGGHASERASEPRYSISMEFQHEESSLPKISSSSPMRFPSFWERLWLISHQLLLFEHRTEPINKEVMVLGTYIRRINTFLGDRLKEQPVLESGDALVALQVMADELALFDDRKFDVSSSKNGATMSAPPSQLQARSNIAAEFPSTATRKSSKTELVSLPPSKHQDTAPLPNAWTATLPPVKREVKSGTAQTAGVATLPPTKRPHTSMPTTPIDDPRKPRPQKREF